VEVRRVAALQELAVPLRLLHAARAANPASKQKVKAQTLGRKKKLLLALPLRSLIL